jgi:hypothetical protein
VQRKRWRREKKERNELNRVYKKFLGDDWDNMVDSMISVEVE